MLYMRDFKGTERYKKAGYFVFTDVENNIIGQDDRFLSEIAPVLLWEDLKDGGANVKLAIYKEMPKDYKLFKEAPKAPHGYEWIYNGKTLNDGRCVGLLKTERDNIKFPNLEKCEDYKYLNEYLTDKKLDIIENIIEAYHSGEINLIIPRNEKEEVEWDGDWDIKVIDPDNEQDLTGYELLVLKWYEGFEDTGYLIESMMF